MVEQWVEKKVLITVRTYPVPSKKQIEVSCTAGITDDGKWIRLYPVPYRFLNPDKRFSKYQCIEASVMKSVSDARPESFKVNPDTIKIIHPAIPTSNKWEMRKEKVFPLKARSLCELESLRNQNGYPTLGFIKPKSIISLDIKSDSNEWTESQLMNLHQFPMFNNVPKIELEKIPFEFSYTFRCDDPNCNTHQLSCTDWEMGASYRSWKIKYGKDWEAKFRERYDTDMRLRNDTHFFIGTIHGHPNRWLIIGLFYPPL